MIRTGVPIPLNLSDDMAGIGWMARHDDATG